MQFFVTTRDGVRHDVEGREGLSLMQNIRNAGIEELQAICHIYVDSLPTATELPTKSRDEDDLLDASDHLEPSSRLACQLVFGPALDGIRLTIAPED
jgi:2Fe-2S ferredoxin